jgi:hypothetical protein
MAVEVVFDRTLNAHARTQVYSSIFISLIWSQYSPACFLISALPIPCLIRAAPSPTQTAAAAVFSLPALCAAAERATDDAHRASEAHIDEMRAGTLSVDAFVKQFAPARRVFHARRTKLEQLHRIRAAADGGSGSGAVQPSAVSSFLPASSSVPLSGAGVAPRVAAGSLYQPAPVSSAAPNRL